MENIRNGATVWVTRTNEVVEYIVETEAILPNNEKRYNLVSKVGGERISLIDPSFIYTNKAQASQAVIRAMGETP